MDICSVPVAELTSRSLGASLPTPTPARISERRACRVCGRTGLLRYVDLGAQPLANALREPDDVSSEARYPLVLQACMGCKLSQLTHVVPKEALYTTYAYSSGVSAGWKQHCAALAQEYARKDAYVVDIASNDGTLVREFTARGCEAYGVEPSESFADANYNVRTAWWTHHLVQRTFAGRVDVLTAQNVLGHVDDVHDFAKGIATALNEQGIALIEVPYVMAMFEALAFDTIYHEHLSYWSVTALNAVLRDNGLVLRDVQPLDVHGGSIRAIVAKSGRPSDAVTRYLVTEHHDLRRSAYMQFSARVTRRIAEISAELAQCTPYYGFGAAAKATVMLGCLDVRAFPRAVFDATPAKQGKLIPGTKVPIEATPASWASAPGPLCIFAWNWAGDIIPQLRSQGYAGAIFVPLPKPRWDTV